MACMLPGLMPVCDLLDPVLQRPGLVYWLGPCQHASTNPTRNIIMALAGCSCVQQIDLSGCSGLRGSIPKEWSALTNLVVRRKEAIARQFNLA